METKRKGRPPKAKSAMLAPVTLRLPKAVLEELDMRVADRANEGIDRATVIREVMAAGLEATRKKR